MTTRTRFSVYVVEIAVLAPSMKRISYWEVWRCFNTRREARDHLNREAGNFEERKVPRGFWRIRKYIPESEPR